MAAIVIIGLVVLVVLVVSRPDAPELANVETFPHMGGGHLSQGEAPPEYNSTPPTSGRHSPSSTQCGIYLQEIPDPVQVHNLEHGTIIIQYGSELSESEVVTLQDYARSKSTHILVAPNSGLSHPIVITSWTRMLRLESVDTETIDIYYEQYAQRGPEAGVGCLFSVDQAA